jgi:hypothetical protein
MKKLSLLALVCGLIAVGAIAQTTVTIPAQTVTVNIPAQTITIPASSTTPPVVTPPVVTPGPTGVTWGYSNGQWNWAGDFTQNGTGVDYHHATANGLNGHAQDILFTSSVNWGLWLPYFAPGSAAYAYPNPGFTSLLISIRPTVTGQAFGIFMMRTGDVDPGCHLELLNYGPPTVAGQWSSYVVPLKDLCVAADKTLYKLGLQDHAAHPSSWEIDNVGFLR